MPRRSPEILAPAGDRDALAAALAAGAGAVYFGLDDGFNARARAVNFASDSLADTVAWIHRARARAYVTLNTLVFEPELPIVEELIRRVAAAGCDAIIAQDPAVALLARAICPALEVHASTQMTASSPLAAELLRGLGIARVVVPRELSVDDIRRYAAGTSLPLEVFIHGALCVSWSGQCLSSEAWGGRSANRGQCAQACRLPYQLVIDDRERDLGDVAYLLSPKDLVGLDAVPALADIGVASLKIEGRLKGPSYVAMAVAQYRAAVDAASPGAGNAGHPPAVAIPADEPSLHIAYSRGVSSGFLFGADHQTLVEGRFPQHRGVPLGRVARVERDQVLVIADLAQRVVTGGVGLDDGAPAARGSELGVEDRSRAPATGGVGLGDHRDRGTEIGTVDRPPAPATGGVGLGDHRDRGTEIGTVDRPPAPARGGVGHHGDRGRELGIADRPRAPAAGDGTDARTRVVPRAGMGVVFDRGRPGEPEEGGPIFAVSDAPGGHWLRFGRPGPSLAHVRPGDFVWISSDPRVTRAADQAVEAGHRALGRISVDLTVRGELGAPLEVIAAARGHTASVATTTHLDRAAGAGLSHDVLAGKLGALGGTPFHLGTVDTTALAPGLHVPVGELKELRRAVVARLTEALVRVDRVLAPSSVIDVLRRPDLDDRATTRRHDVRAADSGPPSPTAQRHDRDRRPAVAAHAASVDSAPIVVPLCRSDAQLDAVLEAGATCVELDWMELVGLARAVTRARARGAQVGVATVRVQKPGEERIDQHLARLAPDHVLVRSWGSLAELTRLRDQHGHGSRDGEPTDDPAAASIAPPALHGDFSLNVTNSITAAWVLGHGLATVTAAHDLDRDQLFALLARAPRGRIAVTIHHHVPTFHTEHCVYAHLLSTGRDYRTCGRPCERHQVALRDRVGLVHPVVVDVGCRNTVFNAQAQSAASLVPDLLARGVRRFRVELVRESADEAVRVFSAYRQLVAGQLAPAEVVRRAAVHEQFGVTRGTMRTLTVLR